MVGWFRCVYEKVFNLLNAVLYYNRSMNSTILLFGVCFFICSEHHRTLQGVDRRQRQMGIGDRIQADVPGDRRAWNMAHLEGITNGLLLMTTAIPLFFKPILYKDCYYIDGGLSGNLPIEGIDVKKDNYLGIYISGNKEIDFKKESIPILAFLSRMLTVSSTKLDVYLDRCIVLIMEEDSTQFEFTGEEKQNMIDNAYNKTILQINDKFKVMI